MMIFITCVLFTKVDSGDQIKENKIDRACGMYKGEVRCIWGFGEEPEGRRPLGKHRPCKVYGMI
jgi:hypothetical protein